MRSLVEEIQDLESALQYARHPAEAAAIRRSLDRLYQRYESLRAGSAAEGDERMARAEVEAEREWLRETEIEDRFRRGDNDYDDNDRSEGGWLSSNEHRRMGSTGYHPAAADDDDDGYDETLIGSDDRGSRRG